MSVDISAAESCQWPPEVAAFAAKHGAEEYLPGVLEMTRALFPAANRIEALLEPDGDLPDCWFIVIDVEISGWEIGQAVAARQQWVRNLLNLVPASRNLPFVLGLELVT